MTLSPAAQAIRDKDLNLAFAPGSLSVTVDGETVPDDGTTDIVEAPEPENDPVIEGDSSNEDKG